jgi:hypothetical protein
MLGSVLQYECKMKLNYMYGSQYKFLKMDSAFQHMLTQSNVEEG